jgi:hypothetical protein
LRAITGLIVVFIAAIGISSMSMSRKCFADTGEADKMLERKSYHFVVSYHQDVERQFLRRVIDLAEDCYRWITQDFNFFRDDPWVWDNRAVIYVYKDRSTYLSRTGMPEWSWAAAQPERKEVHTFDGPWDMFRFALVHELTHLIFREYVGMTSDIPLCFDEGAAVYMERRHDRAGMVRHFRKLLESEEYIPLRDLVRMRFKDLSTPGGFKEGENDRVTLFYLESFSLIHFLLEKYDRFRFSTFARKLRDGVAFEEAFFETYRLLRTWDNVEREWLAFYGK